MEIKKIKLKSGLIPKKDTHKYEYLFENYLFKNNSIDTLDLSKYRLDYINLILNNAYLVKKLEEESYKKLKFINSYLGHNYELPSMKELNSLFKKLTNPKKVRTTSSYNFKIITDINGKKKKVKKSSSPHIVYNRNG